MFNIDKPQEWDDYVKRVLYDNRQELLLENTEYLEYLDSEKRYFESSCRECRNKVFKNLIMYLLDQDIIAYHCTRATDDLISKGLRVLTPREHLKYCMDKLGEHLSHNEIKNISVLARKYDLDGNFKNRQNMIWYVLTEELIRDIGFKDSYKYFGGEVFRRIIYDMKDIVYPVLQHIGKPMAIKFKLPAKDIKRSKLEYFVNRIIDYELCSEKEDFMFRVEGYSTIDILSSNILEIIDIENYWD